jgi:5-oxoprolinase (ATP-hydrolysing) subunit A
MLKEGAVIAVSGKRIPIGIDSVCVHGDTRNAVAIAQSVRQRLIEAGIQLKSFVSADKRSG